VSKSQIVRKSVRAEDSCTLITCVHASQSTSSRGYRKTGTNSDVTVYIKKRKTVPSIIDGVGRSVAAKSAAQWTNTTEVRDLTVSGQSSTANASGHARTTIRGYCSSATAGGTAGA